MHKHLQLGTTNDQRFRFASLMSLAADDAGMSEGPEFRSALVAYLEWGTRPVFAISQDNADIVEQAPVPGGDGEKHRPIGLSSICGCALRPKNVYGAVG